MSGCRAPASTASTSTTNSAVSSLPAGLGREVRGGAVDNVAGHVGQPLVGVAGTLAEQREGLVHVQAGPLGELALGLLDNDPAIQCRLELLGEGLGAAHVPFLQQADSGDVRQRLTDSQLGPSE